MARQFVTRTLRGGAKDDGAFDRAFWQGLGAERILRGGWALLLPVAACSTTNVTNIYATQDASVDSGQADGVDASDSGSTDGPVEDASQDAAAPDVVDAGAFCTIAWKSSSKSTVGPTDTAIDIALPANVTAGDTLLAFVGFGGGDTAVASTAFVVTAPAGWIPVIRVDSVAPASVIGTASLAVYQKVAVAAEPSTIHFSVSAPVFGAAVVSAYSGVSTSAAVDTSIGRDVSVDGGGLPSATVSTPATTTSGPAEMLVGAITGRRDPKGGNNAQWSVPSGVALRQEALDLPGLSRSTISFDLLAPAAGPVQPVTATATVAQDLAEVAMIALRPCRQ